MLEDVLRTLEDSIQVNSYTICSRNVTRGRFTDEVNVDIVVRSRGFEAPIMASKMFFGRPPIYKPWIELFNIHHRITIGRRVLVYFDSVMEDGLLDLFSKVLKPAESIFVEYYNDIETAHALKYDVPPPVTRLGHKLFQRDFTWFKDWYFPEGHMEGGQRLQSERPLNDESRIRHLRDIKQSIQRFLNKDEKVSLKSKHMAKAIERANTILSDLCHSL